MNGKQKRVKVYQNGKLIKTYETIMDANKKFFPDKKSYHLNNVFNRTNGIVTIGDFTLIKTNEKGVSQNYRRYYVKDKHANKTFTVIGTAEVLKIILYGHDNFHRQIKRYGNYEDNQFTVWRIN